MFLSTGKWIMMGGSMLVRGWGVACEKRVWLRTGEEERKPEGRMEL